VRRRYVWDPQAKALVEITQERSTPQLHYIQPDLPDYESPIDGRVISGRKQRREDLLRSGSRPYEGRAAEVKEANRARIAHEKKLDQIAEKIAYRAWDQAPERIRKQFRSR
jgi:hypothetical protein